MFKFLVLFLFIVICNGWRTGDNYSLSSPSSVSLCETPKPVFSQGLRPARKRGRLLQFDCMRGYRMIGSKYLRCKNGKYDGDIPMCAKRGCEMPTRPENSIMLSEYHLSVLRLECNEGYTVVGSRMSVCTGRNWTVPIGSCRETNTPSQLSCDFESEDFCGWTHDDDAEFKWKRMTRNTENNLRTGPKSDHTTGKTGHGHFMLAESRGQEINNKARLISPVYNSSHSIGACVRLWYFMHGAAVETLAIHFKTESVEMDSIIDSTDNVIWNVTRESFDGWRQAFAHLQEVTESFQIIIEAQVSGSHLGDIAVDDFEIFPCSKDSVEFSTESSDFTESTDSILVVDFESCLDRCSETESRQNTSKVTNTGVEVCDCHQNCVSLNSCCPDYETKCLDEVLLGTTQINDEGETTLPTTTTTVAPITNKPTTTTTTTTTPAPTTRKPITTTTTTTKKPTTTTTTTTTKKPTTTTTTTPTPATKRIITKPTTTTTTTIKTTTSTTPASATKRNIPTSTTSRTEIGTVIAISNRMFDYDENEPDDEGIYDLSVWQILLWSTISAIACFSILFLLINFYKNKYRKFQNEDGFSNNSTKRNSDNSNQLSIRFNTREEQLDFRTAAEVEAGADPEQKPPIADPQKVDESYSDDDDFVESEERRKPYGKLSFPKNRKYSML